MLCYVIYKLEVRFGVFVCDMLVIEGGVYVMWLVGFVY